MESVLMLVIGLIVGGGGASAAWAVIGAGRKKRLEGERLEKEQVMQSVAVLFAEADAIEAKFRGGTLPRENFRRSLSDKSGAAMGLLRTNMHNLDVFFVKYAEQQVRDYIRQVENPERRKGEPEIDEEAPLAPVVTQEALADTGAVAKPAKIAKFSLDPAAPPPPPISIGLHRESAPSVSLVKPSDAPAVAAAEPVLGEVAEEFELPAPVVSAGEPVLGDAAEEFELPAPVVSAGEPALGDVAEEFELPAPVVSTAEPVLGDVAEEFELPAPVVSAAEPVLGDVAEEFELPVSAVSMGELVLGDAGDEAEFDISAAAPAPVSAPAFVPAPASGARPGQFIDDFEAAFAQFEGQVALPQAQAPVPAPAAASLQEFETPTMEMPLSAVMPSGVAPVPAAEPSFEPSFEPPSFETSFEPPSFEPSFEPVARSLPQSSAEVEQMLTETSTIDRSALMGALATGAPPPYPYAQPAQQQDSGNAAGITGDDVMDSIDNLFGLK